MVNFIDVIKSCILIKKTNKIDNKIKILDILFKKTDYDDIEILYKIFTKKKMDSNTKVGKNVITLLISNLFNVDKYDIQKLIQKFNDYGSVYYYLFEKKFGKRINKIYFLNTLKNDIPLSLKDFNYLISLLSTIKGNNSTMNKIMLLKSFLSSISKYEAKYVICILLAEFKVGIGEKLIIKFLSIKYNIDILTIENAFLKTNNMKLVLETISKYGYYGLKNLTPNIFTPIKFMLASIVPKDINSIFKRRNKWIIEYKYDGIRIQIHKKDENIKIYTRGMEDISYSIPDAI